MESLRCLSSGLAALSAALVAVALSASPALAAGTVLTPSPQTVVVGETIDVSVTGFKPCGSENLAVLWGQSPLSYGLVAGSLTANDFTVDFVVPPAPAGSHLIAAGCQAADGEYALQQRVLVKVVAAALALAPSPQNVQAGGRVTMTGSGFIQCTDPAGSTTVELSSATGTPLATASGLNGAFEQAITVPPGTAAGPYPVTAQCPAQPGSALISANVYVVTLTLKPSSGIPGKTISVAGAGYTQCREMQVQLLQDTTQAMATSSPVVPVNGSFTTEVTIPSSAAPGTDYQVDAGCYPAAGSSAAIAVEPFVVRSPARSASPTPSSTPSSSTSPSPAHSGTTTFPSSPGSPSPQSSPHTSHLWAPVALVGGTGAGLALAALFLVRGLSMIHGKRGRGWVSKHLRVVAGSAGPLSADVEHRPGAASVSVGLQPHSDHLGHQQCEEVRAQ